MQKFLATAIILLGIISLTALNIGLSYLLPYPYSEVNIVFAVIILLILWWNSGWIIWIAFFSHLFIELFTVTPYGVVLFSATLATLSAYWLYQHIFTNRSILATAAICFFTLLSYRSLYSLILYFSKIFHLLSDVSWHQIFITSLWELFFTGSLVMVVYFLSSRFSKKFDAAVVESKLFKL